MWANMRQKIKLLSDAKQQNSPNSGTDSAYSSSPDCPPKNRKPFEMPTTIELRGLRGNKYVVDTRSTNRDSIPWLSQDIRDSFRELHDKSRATPPVVVSREEQNGRKPLQSRRERRFGPRPNERFPRKVLLPTPCGYQIGAFEATPHRSFNYGMGVNRSNSWNGYKGYNGLTNRPPKQVDQNKTTEEIKTVKSSDDKSNSTKETKAKYKTETYIVPQKSGVICTKLNLQRRVIFNDSDSESD